MKLSYFLGKSSEGSYFNKEFTFFQIQWGQIGFEITIFNISIQFLFV